MKEQSSGTTQRAIKISGTPIQYSLTLYDDVLHLDVSGIDLDSSLSFSYILLDEEQKEDELLGTAEKEVRFHLKKTGRYSVRVSACKKDNQTLYAFTTDTIQFSGMAASSNSSLLEERLQEVYCYGGSLSKYFVEQLHIKNISIYCEESDQQLAKMVCKDFQVNPSIYIQRYIAPSNFALTYSWRYTMPPTFEALSSDTLLEEAEETILVVSSSSSASPESSLYRLTQLATKKIIFLRKLLPSVLSYYQYAVAIRDLLERNPGCMVATFENPTKFPADHGTWSENERWLLENRMTRNRTIEKLKAGLIDIPAVYHERGYNVEEAIEVMQCYPQYETENGTAEFYDRRGDLVNIVGGHRVTTDQPNEFMHVLYIIGGCRVFGIGVEDQDTLPSCLQRKLNESMPNAKYAVMNYGAFCFHRTILTVNAIKALSCNPGDRILIEAPKLDGILHFSLRHLFERPHNYGEVFVDCTPHPGNKATGHNGPGAQRIIAEALFKRLCAKRMVRETTKKTSKPSVSSKPTATVPRTSAMNSSLTAELTAYKEALLKKKSPTGSVFGSIVMNCNPFTLGHRYLIEYASAQVDHLYIFVVEEDKSFFPFEDRLALVRAGTADLGNVTVMPSGKFIISSITFSDYFAKQELKDRTIDSSSDVSLFAQEIAPVLDISIRFVGEEPLCNVTRQYNNTMKTILPRFGIELRIIPRKEMGGEPISASRVRALLETKNFGQIQTIVPKTTYEYLVSKYA